MIDSQKYCLDAREVAVDQKLREASELVRDIRRDFCGAIPVRIRAKEGEGPPAPKLQQSFLANGAEYRALYRRDSVCCGVVQWTLISIERRAY